MRTIKTICVALVALTMYGCEDPRDSAHGHEVRSEAGKAVNLSNNPELKAIRASLIDGMTSYMRNSRTQYGPGDIQRCAQILDEHLAAVQNAKSREEALSVVKTTVFELNQLNERSVDLIETDQREQIASFIIKAGALLGFNGEHEDVTEKWREW